MQTGPREKCMYCFEPLDKNGECPACGRDPLAPVSPSHLAPGTVLRTRFPGRARAGPGRGRHRLRRQRPQDRREAARQGVLPARRRRAPAGRLGGGATRRGGGVPERPQ